VREAARAVTYDYGNYSAHLFLADSYNELRDPTRFNLRYETVWFNEYLLANLLAPVGGGRLSQHVTQQEYTSLFERDQPGLASSTTVRTDGQVDQLASQYGTLGRLSWALDLDYQHNRGIRPNNDLDRTEWYSTVKEQVTPQDTAMLLLKYEDYHSGDNFQYYDPDASQRPNYRYDEYQHPIIVGFWHHEWGPGMHTLLMAGRLSTEQQFGDKSIPQLVLVEDAGGFGSIVSSDNQPLDLAYRNKLEIYAGELNQILEWNRVTLQLGGRFQSGSFDAQARLDNTPTSTLFSMPPSSSLPITDAFERFTGYAYLTLKPAGNLQLMGGLAYDAVTIPVNYRHPPLASGTEDRSRWGPKASLVWSPAPRVTFRGAYAKSLGGVSLDESYRLEPAQLAGFPQAFRTLISDNSEAGLVSAPAYETMGMALDLKLATRTYLGIETDQREAEADQFVGTFTLLKSAVPAVPTSTREQVDVRERSVSVTLNQLLGDEFVLGASYQFTRTRLRDLLPGVPVSTIPSADRTDRSDLHNVGAYLLFNHPSGFFARAESHWYRQRNTGSGAPGAGDDFFQHNLFAGYRFLGRRAEIVLGILNLTDENYHLDPLTVYTELPWDRVFTARVNFQF
jgi:outer membrane receptor protein involved in Fe transport